jgi:hypothetical protein
MNAAPGEAFLGEQLPTDGQQLRARSAARAARLLSTDISSAIVPSGA